MSINTERRLCVKWLHNVWWHTQIGLVNAKEASGPWVCLWDWAQTDPWGLRHDTEAARVGVSNLSC